MAYPPDPLRIAPERTTQEPQVGVVEDGFVWIPEEGGDSYMAWRTTLQSTKKCRAPKCRRRACAELRRTNGWWAYCDEHLYGRAIVGTTILHRVMVDSPAHQRYREDATASNYGPYTCGKRIGVPGREGRCGESGICSACFERREDDKKLAEAVRDLPPDLLAVLRDPAVVIDRDAQVWELLAQWRNAPSGTASA